MKRYFTLIIIMLLSLCVEAQLEVQPGSFKEVPGFVILDPDKTDVNDIPYAVIKVRTQNINDKQRRELSFKGDMQTEIVLEYKDGEVWVYLTYLASYLKISHPDFSSTEFTIPFDMKPKCGYELALVNKKVEAPTANFVNVTVTTDAQSDIYVDNEKMGKGRWFGRLGEGAHTFEAKKVSHKTSFLKVILALGKDETVTIPNPEPIYGILDVNTTPPGATIYIDSKNCGITPNAFYEVLIGKHVLRLEKSGYVPVTKTFVLDDTDLLSINEELQTDCDVRVSEKLQTGREIVISTDRLGDEIYCDGKYIGNSPVTAMLTFGSHVIKAERDGKSVQQSFNVSQTVGDSVVSMAFKHEIYGHEYVDLGLPSGLLWATCNIGATNPESYGSKYAWGEVKTKNKYNWKTYEWCKFFLFHQLTKYKGHGRKVLKKSDDVARAIWGGKWRMPTEAEWQELKNNCSWEWTTLGKRNGYLVTSMTNGNSIYLPTSGDYYDDSHSGYGSYGSYWSSSLNTDDPDYAYELFFSSNHVDINRDYRYEGNFVRPVSVPKFKINVVWLWVLIAVLILVSSCRIIGKKRDASQYMEYQKAHENEYKSKEINHQQQITAENEVKAMKAEVEHQQQKSAKNERRARAIAYNARNKFLTVNGVSFEMVAVKGGTFTMGETSEQVSDAMDNEKPARSVTLSDYYIGKFEVTQDLWQAVMGSNPSYYKGNNLPVEQVNWKDCQKFIKNLNKLTGANFRLPTEAEWEYAARGGSKSRGYKYSGSNNISDVAWYDDNSGSKTHPVGTKSPNELGIYDMSGNVWEWCSDLYSSHWYVSYGSGLQSNPQGASSGSSRVRRGGSWSYNAQSCCVSYRNHVTPDRSYNNLGFRLAVSQ